MNPRPGIVAPVRHYLPGGRESGGGIGRLVGYVAAAAEDAGTPHCVTDTRGPRLEPGSLLAFSAAIVTMVADRLSASDRIQHLHVAGRGSTIRKLCLATVARALGARHILHLHDYDYRADYRRRSPPLRSLVRGMFRGADAVVVLGQEDRRLAVEEFGVDPGRVLVLPNAVPDPGPRGSPDGGVRILFAGRLGERKGVPELLQALSDERLAGLDWRAVIAGDGPVEAYRAESARLGLAERVDFPGWLGAAEIRELFLSSHILVLPSRAEGLAMAVIEGYAYGLAVVTTAVGAHAEAVRDGETGLLVPVGDAGALAATLAELILDPARRRCLATAGRERFLDRFSIGSYMRRLDRLYGQVRMRAAGSWAGEEPV